MNNNEKQISEQLDSMPRAVSIELLTSNQRMSTRFKKNCREALWKNVAPVNRTADFWPSAPSTYEQKLLRKLRGLNAKQLCTWSRRVTRRGNRLRDALDAAHLDESPDTEAVTQAILLLENHIAMVDTLGSAIKSEIDRRATGGKLPSDANTRTDGMYK